VGSERLHENAGRACHAPSERTGGRAMAMPLHRTLMTLEEFVALPEDESACYEL
jgi:hypothetical protein